jgi:hypothetical protein
MMAHRSEKQNAASVENGRKSQGPATSEGKAKSAQNARSHGLTGAIDDPTPDEIKELATLRQALKARFDPKNAMNAMLIERVLMSTLRLNRARAIITTKIEELAGQRADILAQEATERVKYMQEVEAALCELTGEKKIDTKLLHLFAESEGFERITRHHLSTKLDQLAKYAQRFRGERDSALKKLEKLRNQQAIR